MVIGIIGIGLIGSSLAQAFQLQDIKDIGIHDISRSHMDQAKAMNLGAHYFDRAEDLAKTADITFICIPVGHIAAVIRQIAPHMKAGSIITDVGSVKAALAKEVAPLLPQGVSFVPGHPISGAEHSGPEAGKADLFRDKPYILVKTAGNENAAQKVATLIQKTGAKISYLDADRHDLILAFTSHLPHICAFAAMTAAEQMSRLAQENVMDFTGGSFRDLTRVAAANPEIWASIFLANPNHIAEAYKLFRQEMDSLVSLIEKSEADEITSRISHAKELRQRS